MEGIVLGQYVPGNSLIHRLDPRSKMIILAAMIVQVFLLAKPVEYLVFGIIIILLYLLSGVIRSALGAIRPGLYLVVFTLLINMFFTPGQVVLNLGFAVATREGLMQGLTIGTRFLYLLALSSLVTLTTSPVRMTDGLEKLMSPLRRVRFPVGELAMMINIALRFIPTFWEETDKIIKAQISRGADFESWQLMRRVRFMTAMLVPLFINAFRKADELSVAMESRGYVVGMRRTSLHELKFSTNDYLALTVIFSITVVVVFKHYIG
jgi:energy-coupling factor transport system permease protein